MEFLFPWSQVFLFLRLLLHFDGAHIPSAFWQKGDWEIFFCFFNLHFCNVIILCYISLTVGWIYNFGYKRSFIMRALLKCLLARKSDAIVIEPLYGQLSLSLELIPSLPLGVLRFHNPEPWHGFIQSFYCTYSLSPLNLETCPLALGNFWNDFFENVCMHFPFLELLPLGYWVCRLIFWLFILFSYFPSCYHFALLSWRFFF